MLVQTLVIIMQMFINMFEFEMTGPYYIYKDEESDDIRKEIIEECLENGKIPFYMSTSNKCEIFKIGKQTSNNLDRTLMILEYPPNTFLA